MNDDKPEILKPWNLWNLPAHPQLYKNVKLPVGVKINTDRIAEATRTISKLYTDRSK